MDIDKTAQTQLANYAILTQQDQNPMCDYATAVRIMADEPFEIIGDLVGIDAEMVLEWCRQGGPGRELGIRDIAGHEGACDALKYYMDHEAPPRESRAHLRHLAEAYRSGGCAMPCVRLAQGGHDSESRKSAGVTESEWNGRFGVIYMSAYDSRYISKLEDLGVERVTRAMEVSHGGES